MEVRGLTMEVGGQRFGVRRCRPGSRGLGMEIGGWRLEVGEWGMEDMGTNDRYFGVIQRRFLGIGGWGVDGGWT